MSFEDLGKLLNHEIDVHRLPKIGSGCSLKEIGLTPTKLLKLSKMLEGEPINPESNPVKQNTEARR